MNKHNSTNLLKFSMIKFDVCYYLWINMIMHTFLYIIYIFIHWSNKSLVLVEFIMYTKVTILLIWSSKTTLYFSISVHPIKRVWRYRKCRVWRHKNTYKKEKRSGKETPKKRWIYIFYDITRDTFRIHKNYDLLLR